MLPDFIIIGASRCGTQWIHDNLEMHPEIFMPKKLQEIHFFSKYYNKGIKYYESLFDSHKDEKAVGEVTPDYIYGKDTPELIKKHIPEVKIIVSLRNPVDRLYSMYWTLKGKFEENKNISFEKKLELSPELINQGFYYEYLSKYYNLFKKEHILVLFFEQIKSNPEQFLKKIYDFLEIDINFVAPFLKAKINTATFRKYTGKSKLLYFLWRGFRKFKFYKMVYFIEQVNSKKIPPMKDDTRKMLINLYKEKNEELSKFFGIDLSHWNK